jgi:hypothetical protein
MAAGFVVLSFGPLLHCSGKVVVGHLLPYYWVIQKVPVLDGIRVPVRFTLMAFFGLAVAAGHGTQELSRRLKTSLVALLFGFLVFLDFLQIPLSVIPKPDASAHNALVEKTGPCVVLDAPADEYFTRLKAQYLQMDHELPTVTGALGRDPGHTYAVFDSIPHLGGILMTDGAAPKIAATDPVIRSEVQWLMELGVESVVFHRSRMESNSEDWRLRQLHAALGPPEYTDSSYVGWVLGFNS